jgi:hypothetical protein
LTAPIDEQAAAEAVPSKKAAGAQEAQSDSSKKSKAEKKSAKRARQKAKKSTDGSVGEGGSSSKSTSIGEGSSSNQGASNGKAGGSAKRAETSKPAAVSIGGTRKDGEGETNKHAAHKGSPALHQYSSSMSANVATDASNAIRQEVVRDAYSNPHPQLSSHPLRRQFRSQILLFPCKPYQSSGVTVPCHDICMGINVDGFGL